MGTLSALRGRSLEDLRKGQERRVEPCGSGRNVAILDLENGTRMLDDDDDDDFVVDGKEASTTNYCKCLRYFVGPDVLKLSMVPNTTTS